MLQRIRGRKNLTTQQDQFEVEKLRLECAKLARESRWWWQLLQAFALVAPALAVIVGFGTILIGGLQLWAVQQRTEEEGLRVLLKDVGSADAPLRLNAISRLSIYQPEGGWFASGLGPRERSQIVATVAQALWLEETLPVKLAMLQLLERRFPDIAVAAIKPLQYGLATDALVGVVKDLSLAFPDQARVYGSFNIEQLASPKVIQAR